MRFAARNFPRPLPPVVTYTATHVTIRHDDAERPDSWAELTLTIEDLRRYIDGIDRVRFDEPHGDDDEEDTPIHTPELGEAGA